MKAVAPWRARIIAILALCFAFILVGRLYNVQIMQGDMYREKAESQYIRSANQVFERGNIYFLQKDGGRYSAAVVKSGFILAINPRFIKDPQGTWAKINSIVKISKEDFLAKAKKDDSYEEIQKRIDQETGEALIALKLPGVVVARDKWRVYPGGKTGANVLGFVGYKGNELVGRYGLERFYEDTLKRKSDTLYVNFFAEVFSNLKDVTQDKGNLEGDIVSTIEPNVQLYLEQQLKEFDGIWKPDLVGGIIMDPNTGEIRALGVYPSFDPNAYGSVKDISRFGNPLVESVYEMGSIIKPITMAAGIDAGAVTAATTYDDKGVLKLDGQTITNFDKKSRGVVDMQTVLSKSLNTGVSFVVGKMGKQKFADYFRSFGFAEPTNIDLPGERKNLIENLKSPRDVEYATASFGQGVALTPISVARALSVLANGGKLIEPHVIKSIDYRIGIKKEIKTKVVRQVIKPETSKEITRMLTVVVDTALRDGKVKLEHYKVAAKTGTAQMSKPTGGYYEDRYLHSFFGYFPSTNPQYLIFLYTLYPKGANYASETLTPTFMNLTKQMISYYNIPPDR